MSSSKLKKKSKSAKLPEPIKIKKEDDHLIYPMEHYVDDRVELIRQIFSSLKPKTITNLAPDFLKKNKLEDIQEQCLNEILGISKKRLLSIINSTKCPTDTDTSSEEEINAVTEHISLEEISSDSDIVDSRVPRTAGKKKRKVKKESDNKQPDKQDKQFSVLELLELQARARAIRSQLALEPVTKIEVGTDSEEDAPSKQKSTTVKSVTRKKPTKTTNGTGDSTNSKSESTRKPSPPTLTVIIPNGEPAPAKRIKLKRNFRKQPRDDSENSDSKSTEVTITSPEKVVFKNEVRSPSPDVIPIVAVPETLCISDSDEEKKALKASKSNDENVETLTKSPQRSVEILSEAPLKKPENQTEVPEEPSKSSTPTNQEDQKDPQESEEEGEIVDDEDEELELVSQKNEIEIAENSSEIDKNDDKIDKNDKDDEVPIEHVENKESTTTPTTESNVDDTKEICETIAIDEKPPKMEISESEDDDNDDVISLEGGDLVDEMKEHMKDEPEDIPQQPEIICLDDSSEEDTKKKNESWNDRWLNSRKVSRVLATSRLANKVRNKIKESKKAKKLEEAAAAMEKEQEKPQKVVFVSKHELGSVEQYRELLERESLPKKSSD